MSGENPNVIARNADGSPLQSARISENNTLLVPPGTPPMMATPFIGGKDYILDFVGITLTLATAQGAPHTGTLFFEFSPDDGVHWDISVPVLYASSEPFVPYPLRKVLPWFRVRYEPNDDNLTEFRLTTIYHRLIPEILTRLFNQNIKLSEPTKVMRAGMMAENEAGTEMRNLIASVDGLYVDTHTMALEATQLAVKTNLETLNSLVPSKFDNIQLSYTGADLASVIYKLGATVISTLTLGYVGDKLVSVVRT